ncbi:MAG: hypothetical protein V4581_13395 [Bacteroidota bacterium]
MKKHFYLVMAFCLMAAGANAQKLTEKDLQGHWNLMVFDISGIILDIKNDKVTLSDEVKGDIDEETAAAITEGMAGTLEVFKGAYIDFSGKNATVFLDGEEKGTFVVTQKDSKNYVIITYTEDGTEDEYEVSVKGKELHVFAEEEGKPMEFIYEKK